MNEVKRNLKEFVLNPLKEENANEDESSPNVIDRALVLDKREYVLVISCLPLQSALLRLSERLPSMLWFKSFLRKKKI